MRNIRRKYAPAFKAKVALEAIKREKISAELVSEYEVHSQQIRRWKSIATDGAIELFTDNRQKRDKEKNILIEELYKQIGYVCKYGVTLKFDKNYAKCGYCNSEYELIEKGIFKKR